MRRSRVGANVDPARELQSAAVDSIRRLKALQPEVVHLSHCTAYTPVAVSPPSLWSALVRAGVHHALTRG